MAGIQIDWVALEAAFENHAPDVTTYLERETGEIRSLFSGSQSSEEMEEIRSHPEKFIKLEPVPSREQYRMMERFIDTVIQPNLKAKLTDSIVGKGAFRRFKDAVAKSPEERKRWFAYRDVLLHRFIFEWLKQHSLEFVEVPDWSVDLPETPAPEEAVSEEIVAEPVLDLAAHYTPKELSDYLQAWARSHGEEYRYLFGPAAFARLAEDMSHEFTFYSRTSG
ncbi:MAG: hypothetical protein GY822_16400 [Deltaproteobacteria bacterium]|nr:hypothetical protein [Deltaproteobacteria bacterium]